MRAHANDELPSGERRRVVMVVIKRHMTKKRTTVVVWRQGGRQAATQQFVTKQPVYSELLLAIVKRKENWNERQTNTPILLSWSFHDTCNIYLSGVILFLWFFCLVLKIFDWVCFFFFLFFLKCYCFFYHRKGIYHTHTCDAYTQEVMGWENGWWGECYVQY